MSGILSTFFNTKKSNSIDNNACKYLTSYNNNLRLFNYGLLLSENNILRIKKYIPTNKFKYTKIDNRNYCQTESNPFNTNNINHFYPKKQANSFYEEIIFSNLLKNRKLKPINNHLLTDLTMNKDISSIRNKYNKTKYMNNTRKKKFNKLRKITGTDYEISENENKNEIELQKKTKSLTLKKQKKENSKQVEQIVHSLINGKKIDKQKLHHANSIEYLSMKKSNIVKSDNFPMNKSISPASYIDYNLKKNPDNAKLFKSFHTQVKCLNNKVEYRKRILKQVDENYRHRLRIEDLKSQHNRKDYNDMNKKDIEDLMNDKNIRKNKFHFNLYDYYNNSHKINYFNRFKYARKFNKLMKDNNVVDKNLLTFDRKMRNLELSTQKAVKHLQSLSNSNEKMLKNLLDIYTINEKYDTDKDN